MIAGPAFSLSVCAQDSELSANSGQAGLDTRQVCLLLASSPVIHALCTAFNVGQSGFAPRIAQAVCSSQVWQHAIVLCTHIEANVLLSAFHMFACSCHLIDSIQQTL